MWNFQVPQFFNQVIKSLAYHFVGWYNRSILSLSVKQEQYLFVSCKQYIKYLNSSKKILNCFISKTQMCKYTNKVALICVKCTNKLALICIKCANIKSLSLIYVKYANYNLIYFNLHVWTFISIICMNDIKCIHIWQIAQRSNLQISLCRYDLSVFETTPAKSHLSHL